MDEKEIILQSRLEFANKNSRFYINYINGLERILDFIDKRCPKKIEQKIYQKILISQLSEYELALILYCSIDSKNQLKNANLIKINFFENLSQEILLDQELHNSFARG